MNTCKCLFWIKLVTLQVQQKGKFNTITDQFKDYIFWYLCFSVRGWAWERLANGNYLFQRTYCCHLSAMNADPSSLFRIIISSLEDHLRRESIKISCQQTKANNNTWEWQEMLYWMIRRLKQTCAGNLLLEILKSNSGFYSRLELLTQH